MCGVAEAVFAIASLAGTKYAADKQEKAVNKQIAAQEEAARQAEEAAAKAAADAEAQAQSEAAAAQAREEALAREQAHKATRTFLFNDQAKNTSPAKRRSLRLFDDRDALAAPSVAGAPGGTAAPTLGL